MTTRRRRAVAATFLAISSTVFLPLLGSAHPLGNFTINHGSSVRVGVAALTVDHVVDMAEIPTFSERAGMDTDGDGQVSNAEAAAYEASGCVTQASSLALSVDGHRLALRTIESGLSFPQGQGALTTRLVCVYRADLAAALPATGAAFTFSDSSYAGRRGWREVVVQGDGTTLSDSDAPTMSASQRLTAYPADMLTTPSDQATAAWIAVSGGAPLPPLDLPDARPVGSKAPLPETALTAAVPGGISELGGDLTALFGARELTPLIVLASMLVAAGLGSLHALSPGHGKTVMAAYLVGSRGNARQALGLGLTVTFSHTLGVLALGALSLWAASIIPPERLYPILGVVSGAIVVGIGSWLVWGRLRAWSMRRTEERAHSQQHARGLAHDHEREHDHDANHAHHHDADHAHHHDQDRVHDHGNVVPADHQDDGYHSHGGRRHTHLPPRGSSLSWRGLFALGLAGGMVPSVSALILLLGSLALGRPAYGVALTLAFGVGMAVVLVGVGMGLVYARGLVERLPSRTVGTRLFGYVPTATAFVVLTLGVVITTQALMTLR